MRDLSIRTLNGKDQDNLVFLHDFHGSFHFIVPYNHDHCKQRPKIIQLNSNLKKKRQKEKKRGRQSKETKITAGSKALKIHGTNC